MDWLSFAGLQVETKDVGLLAAVIVALLMLMSKMSKWLDDRMGGGTVKAEAGPAIASYNQSDLINIIQRNTETQQELKTYIQQRDKYEDKVRDKLLDTLNTIRDQQVEMHNLLSSLLAAILMERNYQG